MNALTLPGRANGQLGAVQVNVVDYKPFTNAADISAEELQTIRDYCRRLIDALRSCTTFMTPGDDKVSTEIQLAEQQMGEKLRLNLLLGAGDEPFIKPVSLPLPKKFQELKATTLHEALAAISTPQPGGNVPNMIRNITHVMRGKILPPEIRLLLHSTQEPVFQEWFDALDTEVRGRITMHPMEIPPRKGLHLPYTSDLPGGVGTLGMITPMHSAIQAMQHRMTDLAQCNHVLVSESLGHLVTTANRKYKEFQNPSSAFREQCALENYNLMLGGGRIPFVSLNDEEMVKYVISIESRRALHPTLSSTGGGEDGEKKPKKPSFGYPFDEHRNFNDTTAALATESFNRYFACIPPQNEADVYCPLSVSCGPYGGYHISCTPDGKRYVIFTSTPQGEGVRKMLDAIGPNDEINIETKRTMGAGDAVSSILSLVHLLDVQQMMGLLKTPKHPINPKFIEIAASIFVSLLSRFAGEILYHSNRCDWMSVPPEKFKDIITTTARKSLDLAADMWNSIDPKPTIAREPEWGIDVAMWQL